MSDHIVRALCLSGGIRVLACSAANLAREVCQLQKTSATAGIAMGRGLAGGALMGALLKPGQRIALKFEGNGPLRKLLIEADSTGAICGCAGNPAAEIEPLDGKWNVAGLIGKAGFLTVSKDIGMGGETYQGLVQLISSEIGDDLAYYLTESEQTPSAVGLGATLDSDGEIATCGGFLVQALPKADQSELDRIMLRLSELTPISSMLSESGPETILQEVFGDIPYTILESHDIFFRCSCSLDKVEKALISMGAYELIDMQVNDEETSVTCEFCKKTYTLGSDDLDRLIKNVSENTDN